ncbi:transmembrane and coiled-coil domain-containing protein 6 isoform X4 [Sphaeramia orbicularis]|uniref:transmembrane and coiled-coil domain-containing protein 6 isoform X4 n=1 Tax=Sphaeramia orbicularis TaxID=375764 RepID=UPI001180F694|nr:transmembrane and coiled-coil domain-containing protein 6 isoform X4 [Sphaeramia orbicularis]
MFKIQLNYLSLTKKIMWRLNKVRHKAGRHGDSSEQFRSKRREQENALRQARRDRQLVSKRLLLNDDEEHPEVTMETNSAGQDVVSLFLKLQHSGPEKEADLKALSKALRDPSAQLTFIKQGKSMHLLVGLLTGSNAQCRLQAVQCLHELSHSPHATVAPACLPVTPYLLTYLSGQSTRFTELCLYTLGNLCPDSDVVTEKLLAQGIIPALTSCLENQRHNLALVEAVGFTLSQLLQNRDAAEKIIPTVLASSLPSLLLSVLTPDPQFGLAPAIECAWCLHYLTSRQSAVDGRVLLCHGALLQCSSLLVSIGGVVADGKKEEGMELDKFLVGFMLLFLLVLSLGGFSAIVLKHAVVQRAPLLSLQQYPLCLTMVQLSLQTIVSMLPHSQSEHLHLPLIVHRLQLHEGREPLHFCQTALISSPQTLIQSLI